MKKDENFNKVSKLKQNKTNKYFNIFSLQIVAHISRPESGFLAAYKEIEFKGKEGKKGVPGKKKTVTFDQNENKKEEVEESEEKKSKEKASPVAEQWMKNLEMLDLKSLDDM